MRYQGDGQNMPIAQGKFLAIEGGDGVGKSSIATIIADWLRDQGIGVLHTREPGGTPLGERIRALLLESDADHDGAIVPSAELLLLFAARCQHIDTHIIPALMRGDWVICDRFLHSSYAYQGGGRGISREKIDVLVKQFCQAIPDCVFWLDVPIAVAMARLAARSQYRSRFEQQDALFLQRVYDSYCTLAKNDPTVIRIDAAGTLESTVLDIQSSIFEQFLHEKK